MTSGRLSLVPDTGGIANRAPAQRATGSGQMSLPGPAPLRRAMRAAPRPAVRALDPALVRQRLAEGWPRLMLAKFGDDQACADFFGRTRQAASYWRSGHCKPDGGALALAWLRWPEDCAAMCGGAAPVARKDGV